MGEKRLDVTDAELAVLELLWQREWGTIRELTDELYPLGNASDFATVQKLLQRLEKKGFVERQGQKGAVQFRAAVDRDELIGRRLQQVVDSLCDGSLTPLLEHLMHSRKLSREERESLRELLDEELPLGPNAKPRRIKRKPS